MHAALRGVSVTLQLLQHQFWAVNLLSRFKYTVQLLFLSVCEEQLHRKGSQLSFGSTIQHTGAVQHTDAAAAAYHRAAVRERSSNKFK